MFKKSPVFSSYDDLSKWMTENGVPNCKKPEGSYPVVAIIADIWLKGNFVKKYEYITWTELNGVATEVNAKIEPAWKEVEQKMYLATEDENKKVEVYARPECTFNYCPNETICKDRDVCIHPNVNHG